MDTAANRASSIGICIPWTYLLVPDGTIDQGDRQALAHSYSGILADEATEEPETSTLLVVRSPIAKPVIDPLVDFMKFIFRRGAWQ